MKSMDVKFEAGVNIALKIPKSTYEQTLAFYRDILQWEVEEVAITHPTISRTHKLKFGHNVLWLDCMDHFTHSEVWMELTTPRIDEATRYLISRGVSPCDEIEAISADMHWIKDPAGTVFLVHQQ
jgi:hypothetical protein